ncbi:hypothetical protein M1E15_20515 [Bacillus sp. JZ76]
MSMFTEKEVKRAVRDFKSAVEDILNARYETCEIRINTLVHLSKSNPVIQSILDPFYSMTLNLDNIHRNSLDYGKLNLPADIDMQIAYLLKIFELVSKKEINLVEWAFEIYQARQFDTNIQRFITEVGYPCLRELTYRIEDLIEDEVEGKGEVSTASLQIINYGNLSAQNGGTIAVGKDIQQNINYKNLKEEILQKVKESQVVPLDSLVEVERLSDELEEELNQPEPSESRLKSLAKKAYEIGENGLLKVLTTVVTDPRWGQAAAHALLNI